MQSKVTLVNSNQVWNAKRRYKINEVVSYVNIIYQNSTGKNSDPTLGTDWQVVKKQDVVPVIYHDDFIDSGTHEFIIPDGILIQNVFLNGVTANGADWSQTGTLVSVTSAQTDDLVTLTGRN